MLYIKPEFFNLLETNDPDDLRRAVQMAIELEHATMPPYLYALYSLGGTNRAGRTALRIIVQEEMLHMLLACNLLNAIGGTPKIDDPSFVPNYPSPLPGTIENNLIVPLKPYSKEVVEQVFMKIEEPEHPLNFPLLAEVAPPRTIGQFYHQLKDRLLAFGPGIFTGDPARQVTTDLFDSLATDQQSIIDMESAFRAIEFIVEQGEGTSESPLDETTELAHYYRFAELAAEHRLIPNPDATPATPADQQFIFNGTPIPFEPGVLPLRESPKAAHFPEGSEVRQNVDACNRIYTAILGQLHQTFNGHPDLLNASIELMVGDFRTAVLNLVQVDLGDGTRTGPSFEYLGA